MRYVLSAENQEDREITKDEYDYLIQKLIELRLSKYFKELIQ